MPEYQLTVYLGEYTTPSGDVKPTPYLNTFGSPADLLKHIEGELRPSLYLLMLTEVKEASITVIDDDGDQTVYRIKRITTH